MTGAAQVLWGAIACEKTKRASKLPGWNNRDEKSGNKPAPLTNAGGLLRNRHGTQPSLRLLGETGEYH
jgi:hypothetical protein